MHRWVLGIAEASLAICWGTTAYFQYPLQAGPQQYQGQTRSTPTLLGSTMGLGVSRSEDKVTAESDSKENSKEAGGQASVINSFI